MPKLPTSALFFIFDMSSDVKLKQLPVGLTETFSYQNSPFKMCIWHCLTAGLKKLPVRWLLR